MTLYYKHTQVTLTYDFKLDLYLTNDFCDDNEEFYSRTPCVLDTNLNAFGYNYQVAQRTVGIFDSSHTGWTISE